MVVKLIDLKAGILLEKFGKGSHKPGSGSAAALQGMLSAKLIKTVIDLTLKKSSYEDRHAEFLKILSEIDSRIYPTLESLFQKDSEEFDKTIQLRKQRNGETDNRRKEQLKEQALSSQRTATEIPIQIATLCKELAEFCAIVFDRGFRSARGDSGVALNGAVSAIGGCLSIIDLNLSDFENDTWTKGIRTEANKLRANYTALIAVTQIKLALIKEEAEQKISLNSYNATIKPFRSPSWESSKLSYADIEEIARLLQNTLWEHRAIIWNDDTSIDPKDILKAEKILPILGYQFQQHTSLGQHQIDGSFFEIAGIIDKQKKVVAISKKFRPEVINFTSAHELGHALLHKQNILHRDRPLDGSDTGSNPDPQEQQADKFATYFLMPKKQLKEIFQKLFLTQKFAINQNSVFALNQGRVMDFKAKCKNLRGLSRFMASAEYYNGRPFNSLSKVFNVSVEAMAIRLEELDLVEF